MAGEMILHCGGKAATYEQVCDVELPPETSSYGRVAHGDFVRLLREEMKARYALVDPVERFGLSSDGARLFGTMTWNLAEIDHQVDLTAWKPNGGDVASALSRYGLTIAFRNSYDKSMRAACAGGANCSICDNLCIWGSFFTIFVQHSASAWERLVDQVVVKVRLCAQEYLQTVRLTESMKNVTLDDTRSYQYLGLARGRGLLTPTQYERALQSLRASWKEDGPFYQERYTAYALYQAMTDGVKLGAVARKMDQYTGISGFFESHDLVRVPARV